MISAAICVCVCVCVCVCACVCVCVCVCVCARGPNNDISHLMLQLAQQIFITLHNGKFASNLWQNR